MDHDHFPRNAQHQHSDHSATPLATAQATQFRQRGGESAGSEFENRQSAESTVHDPASTSFSSHGRGEGESIVHSIHPFPPVPHEITPFGSQAIHPDPRARPLSVVGTSIPPQNGFDWIVPREDSEKMSRAF